MNTPESLSPAAKLAVDTKVLDGAWSGRGLVKLLAELEGWDLSVETRKAAANKKWIGAIIGTVVGFFLMFVVGAVTDQFLIALPVFLVPLVLIFVFKKKLNALQAADLPNELRKCVRPVLKQLGQDLHPEEKIKGTFQLAGIDEGKPKFKKSLPVYGNVRSLTLQVYEEEVCDLRMPLADGFTAVLRLENTFHKVDKSYRSSRGKYKSKSKWKKMATATAMLVPPGGINWEAGRMQKYLDKVNEKLSFTEKNGAMVARLDRYYKFKSAGKAPEETVPAEDIVKLFVRLSGMRPQVAGGAR